MTGASTRAVSPRSHGLLTTILLSLGSTALDAVLLALALGGAPVLIGHARALTLLAAWGVGGLVLALLAPVRTQEVVADSRENSGLLAGLGLLPLLTPPIAALGERLALGLLPGGPWLRWSGVGISAGGLALRIAAMTQLGSRFSPLVAVQREHALETRGLYARIRHPGYLGSWICAFGAMLAFGSALGLLTLVPFTALLGIRARREEALLERHFGDVYRAYRARTGAFLPRFGAPPDPRR
ncbi:MAG TPA: isoprenylcysteine carboxylmethyltransferase family protein [Candidatus Eisenbacteria bacterium]|jgi:protein-S-isoprenylcysteine O-methyltransferase Ste14